MLFVTALLLVVAVYSIDGLQVELNSDTILVKSTVTVSKPMQALIQSSLNETRLRLLLDLELFFFVLGSNETRNETHEAPMQISGVEAENNITDSANYTLLNDTGSVSFSNHSVSFNNSIDVPVANSTAFPLYYLLFKCEKNFINTSNPPIFATSTNESTTTTPQPPTTTPRPPPETSKHSGQIRVTVGVKSDSQYLSIFAGSAIVIGLVVGICVVYKLLRRFIEKQAIRVTNFQDYKVDLIDSDASEV